MKKLRNFLITGRKTFFYERRVLRLSSTVHLYRGVDTSLKWFGWKEFSDRRGLCRDDLQHHLMVGQDDVWAISYSSVISPL